MKLAELEQRNVKKIIITFCRRPFIYTATGWVKLADRKINFPHFYLILTLTGSFFSLGSFISCLISSIQYFSWSSYASTAFPSDRHAVAQANLLKKLLSSLYSVMSITCTNSFYYGPA